jgi:hypothetical protein
MVKFSSSEEENYILSLTDMAGREVQSAVGKAAEGMNLHTLDLSTIAKGIYMLEIRFNEFNRQVRVIIQ